MSRDQRYAPWPQVTEEARAGPAHYSPSATAAQLSAVTLQITRRPDGNPRQGRRHEVGQRAARAVRAAACITATGASTPVQRVKARAAWQTSIEKPPWASIPRPRRADIHAVSEGW